MRSVVLLGAGLTPQSNGTTILTGLVRIRRDLRLANPPNIALLNKINAVISKFDSRQYGGRIRCLTHRDLSPLTRLTLLKLLSS